jgi:hypothetical protein
MSPVAPPASWRPFACRLRAVLDKLGKTTPPGEPPRVAAALALVDLVDAAPALVAHDVAPGALRVTETAWYALMPGAIADDPIRLRSTLYGPLAALDKGRRKFAVASAVASAGEVELVATASRLEGESFARVVIGLPGELAVVSIGGRWT